jgi:E3 ubiquitin-protein ligase MUL1
MSARDRETAEALVRLAASLDGAVLGLGTAAVAVASWVKYLAVSGQLRLVASAATTSIADLRSLLPGDGGKPRIAAVRGYVRPKPGGSIFRVPGSGENGVIIQHTQMVSRAVASIDQIRVSIC